MAGNISDIHDILLSNLNIVKGEGCSPSWHLAVTAVYCLALLVNMFHMVTIMRLEYLKNKPYRLVLIHITSADIFSAITMGIFYSCFQEFSLVFAAGEPIQRIPMLVLGNLGNNIGFFVFSVGSIEKYIAICRPLIYDSSVLIRKLSALFWFAWASLCRMVVLKSTLEVLYPLPPPLILMYSFGEMFLLCLIPSFVSIILLIEVNVAMNKMPARPEESEQDQQRRSSAVYFTIIFSLFMFTSLTNFIDVAIYFTSGTAVPLVFQQLLIKSTYCIVNTVIYG